MIDRLLSRFLGENFGGKEMCCSCSFCRLGMGIFLPSKLISIGAL